MKKLFQRLIIGAMFIPLCFSGCSDILNEQTRSTFDPDFFKTETGVMGGVTAMYAHLRQFYGQYYYAACQMPTDEYTYAWSADNNFKDIDLSGVGNYAANTVRSDALWNAAFPNINTANGVIENGANAGISDALIAEARFFRAFDYLQLVQTFGGVPLDLGSGDLKFNINAVRVSVRNTVPEVYTRAVFPDLKLAIEQLPEKGRVTGGVTKTLARLMLSKAYLTYAWWLGSSIATYPESSRTDPDGHDAAWYFQQAYNVAVEGIENPGAFKLLDYYYDVHVGSNDRHAEAMLYADHTEDSEFYDGQNHNYFSGGAPGNQIVWFATWNYTLIRSRQKQADGTFKAVEAVQREAAQAYGRPWSCMATPIGVIEKTFADKTNDSRYDGTFVTTFRGNWTKGSIKDEVLYNANNMEVRVGDAILTFLDEDPADANAITYDSDAAKASSIAAGVMEGRSDYVIAPSHISRGRYPNLWKLGTYRTNNGSGLGEPNGGITRPINIAYFSELYFVAAEAAVKGATVKAGKSARELINVIRARAGKWRWDNNGNVAKEEDNSAAMVALTPAVIDIDYILAERSREYFGESLRWLDLVRTQKMIEYASTYEIGSGINAQNSLSTDGDHKRVTYTRNIQEYHYLRPIPTGQLNGLEMSEAEKKNYQNPGY